MKGYVPERSVVIREALQKLQQEITTFHTL